MPCRNPYRFVHTFKLFGPLGPQGPVESEVGQFLHVPLMRDFSFEWSWAASSSVKFPLISHSFIFLGTCRYLYSLPFLDSKGKVVVEDNCVGPLYEQVFAPALAPTLSFVGLPKKVGTLHCCFDFSLH